jgi:hypothetical protein
LICTNMNKGLESLVSLTDCCRVHDDDDVGDDIGDDIGDDLVVMIMHSGLNSKWKPAQ